MKKPHGLRYLGFDRGGVTASFPASLVGPLIGLLLCACSELPPGEDPADAGVPGEAGVTSDPGILIDTTKRLDAAPPHDMARPDAAIWVDNKDGLDSGKPWLAVTMVDVGQGDALLIQLPGGKAMAIDGGPSAGAFRSYLDKVGVSHLDYMFLSHAHADHYTGLNAVTARLPGDCVPRVMDPGYSRMDVAGYKTLHDTAGCRYQALAIDQSLVFDPLVAFEVLGAATMPFPSADNSGVNNTSLMLRLSYGRFSILLVGDSENEAEAAVLHRAAGSLPATVLKAGHHGSCTATASSFLRAVDPAYVLISAGAGNSYGLPNCQTTSKLKSSPAHWFRTDKNGDVRVISDGLHYTIVPDHGSRDNDACPRDCADYHDF